MSASIEIATDLTREALCATIQGKTLIMLDGFATEEECSKGSINKLSPHSEVPRGFEPGTFATMGPSIGYAAVNSDNMNRYLLEAPSTVKSAREAFGGASPIDRLIGRALEIWVPGIKIPRYMDGRRYASQHLRWWRATGRTPPHLDRNRTTALVHLNLTARLAANVYLDVDDNSMGGALELWGTWDQDEYGHREKSNPSPAGYGLNWEDVGPALQIIAPKRGMAILFNAGTLHAVREVRNRRVTNATFFGYSGEDQPLAVFA